MGMTKEDIREEQRSANLRKRVVESRVKLGRIVNSTAAEYQKCALSIADDETCRVSAPLEKALSNALTYMVEIDKYLSHIQPEEVIRVATPRAFDLWNPSVEDNHEWAKLRNTISSGIKHAVGALSRLPPPSVTCHQSGKVCISTPHGCGHFYPVPLWHATITDSGNSQHATVCPYQVDRQYVVDVEMVLNEKTGKRKRNYPVGGEPFVCMWVLKIESRGGWGCIIEPSSSQLFDYTLTRHRTAENFAHDLRLLRALVVWANQQAIPTRVSLSKGRGADWFQEDEICAIRTVVGDNVVVDVGSEVAKRDREEEEEAKDVLPTTSKPRH